MINKINFVLISQFLLICYHLSANFVFFFLRQSQTILEKFLLSTTLSKQGKAKVKDLDIFEGKSPEHQSHEVMKLRTR